MMVSEGFYECLTEVMGLRIMGETMGYGMGFPTMVSLHCRI